MMTRTLSCNVNSDVANTAPFDIYLGADGNLSMSMDIDAVLEYCAQAANTILGEVFLDVTIGIPFEKTAWAGVPNIPLFEAELREAFLGAGGGDFVVEILSLSSSIEGNTLSYEAVIDTIYGEQTLSGIING
jgi:hypothetical protein